MKNSILLKEHFLSVQGEGRYRGELSAFLHFGGCNRVCSDLRVPYRVDGVLKYGCDSYDSVDKAFINEWEKVDEQKLIDIVSCYNVKNIVITGGEPLLNINNEDFINFIYYLVMNKYKITIETNGDIDIPEKHFVVFRKVLFSISPKNEIKDKVYWYLNKDSYIKAIYNHPQVDTRYLTTLKEKGLDVFIMPFGEDVYKIEKQVKSIFKYCIDNGFNFTNRDHLYIFKDEAESEAIIMTNQKHK